MPLQTFYLQVLMFCYCMICSCFTRYQYRYTKHPMRAAVPEGETASIQCQWEPDLLPGHNLKWVFFKGTTVKTIEESDTKCIYVQSNFSTLLIKSFSGNDTGSYGCRISSDPVVVSDVGRVSMLTCTTKTEKGVLGSSLECSSSLDTVNIQWFRYGEPVDKKKHKLISTMTLGREDDGVEFICRATYDSLEIGRCTTIPLILPIDARIDKNPPGSIQVSDKFNLTCFVNADPDKFDYHWMFDSTIIDASTEERYKLGVKKNILTFNDVIINDNGKNVTCTVSHANRTRDVASYIIELLATKIAPSMTTNQLLRSTSPTTGRYQSQSTSPTTGSYQSQNTSSTTIVIGVIAVIVVIFTAILIIYFLTMRRKKRYKYVTKKGSVPLKDSSYDANKERPTVSESRHGLDKNVEKNPIAKQLIPDSNVHHEPSSLNSRHIMPADDKDGQFGSSQVVSYDTPLKANNLDKLDDNSKQGTSSNVENMSELYAKPNKTLSRESTDAMYAKPSNSKPNKSATKRSREGPTQKNVEGLTYADIEFQNGTFKSPEPKDSLEYASVQFNNL